jgi:uncharacterized protein DUF4157
VQFSVSSGVDMFARVARNATNDLWLTKTAKPAARPSAGYFAPAGDTADIDNPSRISWSFENIAVSGRAEAGPSRGGNGKGAAADYRHLLSLPLPIQAKLQVGAVDDPLEREADRVAEQVMRMPGPARVQSAPPRGAAGTQEEPYPTLSDARSAVQRECSCGGSCDKCKAAPADDEHGKVQRKPAAAQISTIASSPATSGMLTPPIVHEVLRSPGQPLDPAARVFFEPKFGTDFSRVRLHSDALAGQSAHDIKAQAYTVGHNIVFGPGRLSLGTQEGRRLLAHELAHVAQQSGSPMAVQRQPAPRDPKAERDAAVAEAVAAFACTTEQVEEQADEEIRLKLDMTKRRNKQYALAFGARDRARVEKHGLSVKDQRDIAVKMRFFEGEAKAAYIRSLAATLSKYPDQALEIMEPCSKSESSEEDSPSIPQAQNTCDAGKKQFLLRYEGEPGRSRCMDIMTDPEYKNLFDRNIESAAGYAVPGTTLENLDYDSFQIMVVKYKNGTSEYFLLDDVKTFYYGAKTLGLSDHTYFKRTETGLIYPIVNDRIYFTDALTPNIIARKNGLTFQVKQLKELYTLLQTAGVFAQIVALNAITEDFKATVQGMQRSRLSGFKSVKSRRTGTGGVEPSGGIPEPLPEDEPTGRIGERERSGEPIGDITISAERRMNGDTYEIDVWGLFGKTGRSTGKDTRKSTDIRSIMKVVKTFLAEGKSSGAKQLKVRGLAIGDKNILKDGVVKVGGLAKSLGGTARVTGPDSIEIVIPLK